MDTLLKNALRFVFEQHLEHAKHGYTGDQTLVNYAEEIIEAAKEAGYNEFFKGLKG